MRLSHSNNIYYPLPLNTTRTTNHSLTLALNEMVPVRPRRQIHYPAGLDINAPLTDVTDTKPNATLYHTNRKLCLEPKVYYYKYHTLLVLSYRYQLIRI